MSAGQLNDHPGCCDRIRWNGGEIDHPQAKGKLFGLKVIFGKSCTVAVCFYSKITLHSIDCVSSNSQIYLKETKQT